MLNRVVRISMVAVLLATAVFALGAPQQANAQTDGHVTEIVHQADISGVIDLVQDALAHHDGLSLKDQDIVYNAIGRTNAAIDRLYDTGATGDTFNTAEGVLLTQLDVLREVEAATLSGDINDLNTVAPMLIDLAQARLAFNRQIGGGFQPLAAHEDVSVIDIARDDSATSAAVAEVVTAVAEGRPVGLETSDLVYQALGETARGLDLLDETGKTDDVFVAAERLLEHRFEFLVNLEEAVISGELNDLKAVAEDWVKLSQERLVFERQVASQGAERSPGSFLDRREDSFFSTFDVQGQAETSKAETQVTDAQQEVRAQIYVVQPNETLSSIAQKFDTTVEQLAQANGIRNPSLINTGMRLVVPAASK